MVTKKETVSWALYDFANSAYTLMILSFVFPIFFREVIAGGVHGDLWWGIALSVSILIGGIVSPVIGAIADHDRKRKSKFIFFAVLSMLGAGALYFTGPGMLFFSLALFVAMNVCFEIAQTLYDSFLLHVSRKETLGGVSGLGWGLGCAGGIVAMLALKPFYGSGYENGELYRLTFPLTALFFFIFALPAFYFIKEHGTEKGNSPIRESIAIGVSNVRRTLREIRTHKKIAWFLAAFFALNDGLVTVFAFMPIYAKVTLGMSFSEITAILVIVQLIGLPSVIFFGWLSDKIGQKKILLVTVAFWAMIVAGLSVVESSEFFYFLTVCAGLVMGASQAVARSWFGKIIPPDKRCEFFGFNSFASKVAATTGPFLFGVISSITSSQRIAVGSLVIYFVVAFIIFARIDDEPR